MARQRKRGDGSTEARILAAARNVFTRKGYAAARTRDIAEEAGINLALLNYYFRSKEKLFEQVMLENIQQFVKGIREALDDESTSLQEKTAWFARNYTAMLLKNPDLPLFIISELRQHPDKLVQRFGISEFFPRSVYFRQVKEYLAERGSALNPVHVLVNTIALCVFPFLGAPILKDVATLTQEQFAAVMNRRVELIPKWIEAMLNIK